MNISDQRILIKPLLVLPDYVNQVTVYLLQVTSMVIKGVVHYLRQGGYVLFVCLFVCLFVRHPSPAHNFTDISTNFSQKLLVHLE